MNLTMALELAGTGCPSGMLARQALPVLAAEVLRLRGDADGVEALGGAGLLPRDRLEPLRYERKGEGQLQVVLSTARRGKLLKAAEDLAIVRPRPGRHGVPSLGALLDAIADGDVLLCRRDDPLRQCVRAGVTRRAVPDPRFPGGWTP
jgi:hypothetical protein